MNQSAGIRLFSLCAFVFAYASVPATTVTVVVPGKSDIWLSGSTNGETGSYCPAPYDYQFSTAPAQNPALVGSLAITGGSSFTFGARGRATVGGGNPVTSPEGDDSNVVSHSSGAEHGIADIQAPLTALLGVFLTNGQPDAYVPPASLDFSTQSGRDFPTLTPELSQPFFIGTGTNTDGTQKLIIAPTNATRLFLGLLDGCNYSDNSGSYTVTVAQASSPATLSLALYAGINITGSIGGTYRIDYSTNLPPPGTWSPLTTLVLTSSPQLFIDTSSPATIRRFYRAVVVQ